MAINIADLFEHAVDAFPERSAIACGDRTVTFAELEQRANRLAHYLARGGVGTGAHVGFYARNSIEVMETIIAAYKLRAVPVNVNYRYVENELRYLFDNADLVALVHDREFAERVAAVLPDAPLLRTVVETENLDSVIADESPERDFGERSPDDLYVLYTGGTTGFPKGVMWRHEDVWRVLGGGIDFYTGEPLPDEWAQSNKGREGLALTRLACAPLIHGAAQWTALPALFAGDLVVLMPQFDPHEVWKAIERHKVKVVTIVGDAMARPLIEAYRRGGYDASSVVAISSHAALFSPSVKEEYLEALPNVVITDAIGSSESGFQGLSLVVKGGRQGTGGPTVNRGPNTIVIDDEGRPVRPGEVGRIARGGHVPLGYYKDPEKSATIFVEVDGKRYVVPGDYGRLEEDGTLTLLGRGNVSVNTGGEKVFPEEVEGALKSHPDVFDALVVGVPDERLGQRVAALIQPRPGRGIDFAALDAHIRKMIAGYKVPRSVWLVEQVGRAPSGKPDYPWARAHTERHEPDWQLASAPAAART
ncbi:MAG TPA: acyl-CoA synthetase [Actinophytocola sp.]|uniref:acyl-CoA synthetase n=1 Tax=Actinophytocola sp. TaxID=1872138 RepID=UPI002DDCFE02|nr:acyl-CoA synthetase [Actinophytocola sp.]HEV2784414.1 acyl-CoA synthetase [Actinophytocola sp.]